MKFQHQLQGCSVRSTGVAEKVKVLPVMYVPTYQHKYLLCV